MPDSLDSLSHVGQISAVTQLDRGSSLTDDQLLGDTTVVVEDASDFDEDGGFFTLDDTVYTYDSADMDTDSLQVVGGLQADESAGAVITVYPKLTERLATVTIPGFDDPIVATVPFSMAAQLPVGTRTPELAETVLVERTAAQWIVADVLTDPNIDGGFIDPPTLPLPPGIDPDGLPPALSPTPTLVGGIGFIIAKWDGITNHDFVRYEVHVSLITGFTPDPSTKVGDTPGTQFTIKNLADGTLLDYGPEDNPTQYFVRVVAYDVDGYAPASSEAAGSMVRVTGPDIAANSIYANNIVGGTITGDLLSATLLLASVIKTAETGSRVEMDSAGIRLYAADGGTILANFPTDGSPVIFGEQLSTNALHVFGQADFDGVVDLNRESVTTLLGGQQQPPPTALSAVAAWPVPFDLPFELTTPAGALVALAKYDGVFYDPNGFGGPTFICLAYQDDDDQTLYLFEISAVDGTIVRVMPRYTFGGSHLDSIDDIVGFSTSTFSKHNYWDIGCARAGSYIYVLAASDNAGNSCRCYSFNQSNLMWTGLADNPSSDIPASGQVSWIGCDNNTSPSTAAPLIVFKNASGNAVVKRYTSAASGHINSPTVTETLTGKSYAANGSVPWGIARNVEGTTNYYVAWGGPGAGSQAQGRGANNRYLATTLAYSGINHDFTNGVRNVWGGIAWDGTRYYSCDGYRLYAHSVDEWENPPANYWYAYTWTDGTFETEVSPRVLMQPENRCFVSLSFSPWTSSAAAGWSANVYGAVTSTLTEPLAGDMLQQFSIAYPDTTGFLDTFTGGPADPASNSFPSVGSGASVQTGGAGFILRGDGTFVLPQFASNVRNPSPVEAEKIWNATMHGEQAWDGRVWKTSLGGRSLNGSYGFYEDFFGPSAAAVFGPFIDADANGGTSNAVGNILGHPGVRIVHTNSNSAARAYLRTNTGAFTLGGGRIHLATTFMIPQLSISTDRFIAYIGFRNDPGNAGNPTDGIFLRYTDNAASGSSVIEFVTFDGGSTNGGLSSGVTLVPGKWYRFEILINEAATSITFFLDDVPFVETNFITGASMGVVSGIEKTIGTADCLVDFDYFSLFGELTTTR